MGVVVIDILETSYHIVRSPENLPSQKVSSSHSLPPSHTRDTWETSHSLTKKEHILSAYADIYETEQKTGMTLPPVTRVFKRRALSDRPPCPINAGWELFGAC